MAKDELRMQSIMLLDAVVSRVACSEGWFAKKSQRTHTRIRRTKYDVEPEPGERVQYLFDLAGLQLRVRSTSQSFRVQMY